MSYYAAYISLRKAFETDDYGKSLLNEFIDSSRSYTLIIYKRRRNATNEEMLFSRVQGLVKKLNEHVFDINLSRFDRPNEILPEFEPPVAGELSDFVRSVT